MKSQEWKTYRTRFLVRARRLSSNLSFVDSLGRQHSGRKGDYLVESSEGVISIAPRQIFEDIYVAMARGDEYQRDAEVPSRNPLSVPGEIGAATRKLPQSYRGRAASGPRLGMM
jgi:hypothetical protein